MLNRDIDCFFLIGQCPNANPFTSPLSTALCHAKSPPSAYPSFSFFGRPPASLRASYLSFITEHFRTQNLLQLFFLFFSQTISLFIPTKSPPLIPLILLLPFLNLSHRLIRSRITHECGMVVPMPALCQSAWVCLCANVSLVGSPCTGGQGSV